MGVDTVARPRRGPRLSSARSDTNVGIIVVLECNTIRFVGVVVGAVNFVGGGVNFVSGVWEYEPERRGRRGNERSSGG